MRVRPVRAALCWVETLRALSECCHIPCKQHLNWLGVAHTLYLTPAFRWFTTPMQQPAQQQEMPASMHVSR